ncbi:uncharacterized protein BDV17DRAFT_222204 [Aspergillus undulatus]|uniref:uncharacterized protein n=1 Tax=Aspergillus undulatus TaxID=1810928 RepID=UPI003CCCEE99
MLSRFRGPLYNCGSDEMDPVQQTVNFTHGTFCCCPLSYHGRQSCLKLMILLSWALDLLVLWLPVIWLFVVS